MPHFGASISPMEGYYTIDNECPIIQGRGKTWELRGRNPKEEYPIYEWPIYLTIQTPKDKNLYELAQAAVNGWNSWREGGCPLNTSAKIRTDSVGILDPRFNYRSGECAKYTRSVKQKAVDSVANEVRNRFGLMGLSASDWAQTERVIKAMKEASEKDMDWICP